jgi:hypothetical protein
LSAISTENASPKGKNLSGARLRSLVKRMWRLSSPRWVRVWRRDFSWKFSPVIVEWERGDLGEELVEVSHEQAEKIVQYFRERWV